jgi:glutathione S-transferase
MMILRSSPASPFVRKVRIAIAVLGFDAGTQIETADTTEPADPLRRQNPLGKIPVLIAEDGTTYYDSRVILEFLDERAGGGRIVPREPPAGVTAASAVRRHSRCFDPRSIRGAMACARASRAKMARSSGRQSDARARHAGVESAAARCRARKRAQCRPDCARLRAWLSRFSFRQKLAGGPPAACGMA